MYQWYHVEQDILNDIIDILVWKEGWMEPLIIDVMVEVVMDPRVALDYEA